MLSFISASLAKSDLSFTGPKAECGLVFHHSNSCTWDRARVWPRFRPADVTCMAKPAPNAAWPVTPTVPGMDKRAHDTSQHPRGDREKRIGLIEPLIREAD